MFDVSDNNYENNVFVDKLVDSSLSNPYANNLNNCIDNKYANNLENTYINTAEDSLVDNISWSNYGRNSISKDLVSSDLSDSFEIYVSLNGSDESGNGSIDNPYHSLGWAIDSANNNTVLYLANGTYFTSGVDINTGFSIDKTISIVNYDKGEVIIDGNGTNYFFDILKEGNLSLNSITLINGFADSNNEAPIRNSGICSFVNSTIKSNKGFLASFLNYGNSNVENSIFNSNNAEITNYGGAITNFGNIFINNSKFLDNTLGNLGSGNTVLNSGNMSINNSYFTSNFVSKNYLGKNEKLQLDIMNVLSEYNYGSWSISDSNLNMFNFSIISLGNSYVGVSISNSTAHIFSSIFEGNIALGDNTSVNIKYSKIAHVYSQYYNSNISADLSYNWWYSNKGPVVTAYNNNITANYWIVAIFSADENPIPVGISTNVYLNFKYTDGDKVFDLPEDAFIPPLLVNFETDNGVFGNSSGYIKNHEISNKFFNNTESTLIYAVIDSQRLRLVVGNGSTDYSIFVSPTGNDYYGDGSKDNPYKTLYNALTKSLNGNTIYLLSGNYNGYYNSNLEITKNITITGIGDVVLYKHLDNYVFNVVEWGILNLNNIVFHSNGTYGNPIVKMTGAYLNVNNCTFSEIRTLGAIYVYNGFESNGYVFINNSLFTNIQGVGIYGTCNLTILNSNFTNMFPYSDTNYYKSCICVSMNIIIDNCSFINNSQGSVYNGYVYSGSSNYPISMIHISNSEFINNLGNTYAASMGWMSFPVLKLVGTPNGTIIKNCYFANNTGNTVSGSNDVINCTFIENTGGIAVSASNIFNSTFIKNANGRSDSDEYNTHGIVSTGGNLTIQYCTFIENFAAYGGVLYNYGNTSINYCIFLNNSAKYLGNDLFNHAGVMNASNNWWGSNKGPNDNRTYRFLGDLIIDNWVIMTLSLDSYTNVNYTVKAALDKLTDNKGNIWEFNKTLPNNRFAYFACEYGTINPIVVNVINNSAYSVVSADLSKDAIVSASIDNQFLNLTINNRSTIILIDNFFVYGENQLINMSLVNVNGYKIINQTLIISILGQNGSNIGSYQITTDSEGKANLPLNLSVGKYTLNIVYRGNGYFESINTTVDLTVLLANSNLITYDQIFYGKNNNFYAILKDFLGNSIVNRTVYFNVSDGKNFVIYYANTDNFGRADIYLSIDLGTYSVKSYFLGDDWYGSSWFQSSVIVNPSHSQIIANNSILYGYGDVYSVLLLDGEGNLIINEIIQLTISQGNISQIFNLTTNDKGLAFILINLLPGKYNISVNYKGDNVYGSSNATAILTVTQVASKILAKSYLNITAQNNYFRVQLVDMFGRVISNQSIVINIYSDDLIYSFNSTTDGSGNALFKFNLADGNYMATIDYEGNEWYYKSTTGSSFIVDGILDINNSVSLTANDLKFYYGEDQYFNISFFDPNAKMLLDKNIEVTIVADTWSKSYNLTTDVDGIARIKIQLYPGNYNIFYKYENLYYGLFANGTNNISVLVSPTTIYAPNIVVTYNEGRYFEATLKDINGNIIKNQAISMVLSSQSGTKTYTVSTDDYGIARLKIDLIPGTYGINCVYNESVCYYGSTNASKIIVTSDGISNSVIIANDLSFTYGKSINFTISLFDIADSPITGQSVIVNITNINTLNDSKIYRLTTDNQGKVYVNTNELAVGEYTILCSFAGNDKYLPSYNSNNIKVLANITYDNNVILNNFTFIPGSGDNWTAKLVDKYGSPIIGQEVALKLINQLGDFKTYWATTNTEGIVKLAIFLAYPGKYTITVIAPNASEVNSTLTILGDDDDISSNISLIAPDFSCEAKSGENFTTKLVDNKSNPLKGIEISLKLVNTLGDSKTYWATTNTEGVAKLPIFLAYPNEYKIVVVFKGSSDYGIAKHTSKLTVTDSTAIHT